MAIELRELHIKAIVDAGGEKGVAGTSQETNTKSSEWAEGQADQLISICIEKIMEILKDKKER